MFSVNAADYGFLPENNGEINASVFQKLVENGGTVIVDQPGVYELSRTIELVSDTMLIFGAGVYLKRAACSDGVQRQSYVFVNRGAFTRSWDQNITITGLKLITSSINPPEAWKNGEKRVIGLNAQLAFFYIKNLIIRDFELLDLGTSGFAIQVCTFENVLLENLHIEGMKDGVHFGKGNKFAVRHGVFRTYDDPIALNANDYATSNPQMGWIENGLIEDCYDLEQPETTGFFARILAGSWKAWEQGMVIQNSDSVLSEGRLYRAVMKPDGETYISNTRPTHAEGTMELDGITWAMVQDDDLSENCGCRNIHFKDIFLEKKRPVAFSIHFDNDNWSRSYYPNSNAPVQKDIIFENIYMLSRIPTFLLAKTPVNAVKVINSVLEDSTIELKCVDTEGIRYETTHLLLSGCTFRGDGERPLVLCRGNRSATLKIVGSIQENENAGWKVQGDVKILESDIPIL